MVSHRTLYLLLIASEMKRLERHAKFDVLSNQPHKVHETASYNYANASPKMQSPFQDFHTAGGVANKTI